MPAGGGTSDHNPLERARTEHKRRGVTNAPPTKPPKLELVRIKDGGDHEPFFIAMLWVVPILLIVAMTISMIG